MMHALGIISMILFTACYIPQIIVIIRTKNVSGISTWLWIMVMGGFIFGIFYVIWREEPVLVVSYSIGFILSLITLTLVVYHRKPKE